jgi:Ohr subfamily peroxiredoxin
MPKELGGPGGAANNPEQLFAAGYAACFHSALKFVARGAKVSVEGSGVTARVGIGRNDSGGFALEAELIIRCPGLDRTTAQDIMEKAHHVCPYSNATRGNMPVKLTLAE